MDEVISISGQVPSQSSISSVPEIPVAVDDGQSAGIAGGHVDKTGL